MSGLNILNELILKPVKGFGAFDRIFKAGKKIGNGSALIVLSREIPDYKNIDINKNVIYFGVSISKKNAKKAVVRNKVKRLLRVSLKNYFDKLLYGAGFNLKYIIIVWKKAPKHPSLLSLEDVYPVVESMLNKYFSSFVAKPMDLKS